MIYDILYMRLRACFDNLFDKSLRKALKEFRRVKGFKFFFIKGFKHSEGFKKISIHSIKFHENNIIRKRVFKSIILFIHFIII